MNVTTNTANEDESTDDYVRDYFELKSRNPLFRVIMTGNIEELAVGHMNYDMARWFESVSKDAIYNYMFASDPYQGTSVKLYDEKGLYEPPVWPQLNEEYHMCGLVIDEDFRVFIEDWYGDEIVDLTASIRRQAGPVFANDNYVTYEVGDYNGVSGDKRCRADEANAGIFTARSYGRGMFTYTFELDDVLDPDRIQIPLQDLTTHHLTTGVFYDGVPADDFSSYRWPIRPSTVTFDLAEKMAA